MNKKTIEDIDVRNKKVLVRCDFNVPQDEQGNITAISKGKTTIRVTDNNTGNQAQVLVDVISNNEKAVAVPDIVFKFWISRYKNLISAIGSIYNTACAF